MIEVILREDIKTLGKAGELVRVKPGYAVDRRRIELEHPIKTLGEHTVSVRIHPDVHAEVRVSVVAE